MKKQVLLSLTLLPLALWPAIFNRAPILFSDTANYLLAMQGQDTDWRALGYTLLMRAASVFRLGFWPVVVFQSWVGAWVILEIQEKTGKIRSPGRQLAAAASLLLLTSFPWFCSQVLSDFFVPIAVISGFFLLNCWDRLSRPRRWAWLALFSFSSACHLSLPLSLSVSFLAWSAMLASKGQVPKRFRVRLLMLIALPFLVLPVSRWLITGNFSYSRSYGVFLAARLSQDGLLGDYLDETCPGNPQLTLLCGFPPGSRHLSINEFLWADPPHPLLQTYGWTDSSPELWKVSLATARRFPFRFLSSSFRQGALVLLEDGFPDGFLAEKGWLGGTIARVNPSAYSDFGFSRQELAPGGLSPVYDRLHPLFRAVVFFSVAVGLTLLPIQGIGQEARAFFLLALTFACVNSAISGTAAGAFSRYESRCSWLLPLAAILMLARFRTYRLQIDHPAPLRLT